MNEVFVGSEALRGGTLTRSRLRWNYTSIYPDVYVPNGVAPSLREQTVGAWLWSRRRGIVAGRAAAALHGALWVHPSTPIELITPATRPPRGILTRDELISDDELDLIDGGAQSPKETWLRLLVIDEGFPRPRTQIRVTDGINNAFLDMGWDEPMIGLDYDGEIHQTDRPRFIHDIGRNELVRGRGWLDLHVVAEHGRAFIVHRLKEAFGQRQYPLCLRTGS